MDLQKLKADLTRDESSRQFPYMDCCGKPWRECSCIEKGKLTIGIGRNLDDVGLSPGERDFLLGNDITTVEADLDMALPFWRSLSEGRQRALANMCFNMGVHKLLLFQGMLAAMRAGDWAGASSEALDSAWAREVGPRAQRIAVLLSQG